MLSLRHIIKQVLGREFPEAKEEDLDQAVDKWEADFRPSTVEIEPPATRDEELQRIEGAGVEWVRILSQRDADVCPACDEADGMEYPAAHAKKNRLLPHPACTNRPCRCCYLPIIGSESSDWQARNHRIGQRNRAAREARAYDDLLAAGLQGYRLKGEEIAEMVMVYARVSAYEGGESALAERRAGEAYYLAGDFLGARRHLARALQLDPQVGAKRLLQRVEKELQGR